MGMVQLSACIAATISTPSVTPAARPRSSTAATSPFLRSLRQSRSATPSAPPSDHIAGGQLIDGIDTLAWSKDRVVWSRYGSICSSYSFANPASIERERGGAAVVQALFAYFDVPTVGISSSNVAMVSPTSEQSTSAATPSMFGPFHHQQSPFSGGVSAGWSDDPFPLPTDPPALPSSSSFPLASDPSAATSLARHLIIFLSSQQVYIYPAAASSSSSSASSASSSSSYTLQLPFRLHHAWSLDRGMILERAREGYERDSHVRTTMATPIPTDDVTAMGGASDGVSDSISQGSPTLYYLMHPSLEIQVVSQTTSLICLFPPTVHARQPFSTPIPRAPPTSGVATSPHVGFGADSPYPSFPKATLPLQPIRDLNQRFILISSRRDRSEPVAVSIDRSKGTISVWSYGRIRDESCSDDQAETDTRKEDVDAALDAQANGKPGMDEALDVNRTMHDLPTVSSPLPPPPSSSSFSASTSTSKRKRTSILAPEPARSASASSSNPLHHHQQQQYRLPRRTSTTSSSNAAISSYPHPLISAVASESDESELLLEALGETNLPHLAISSMSRTLSTSPTAAMMSAIDRRGSMTRNELSVTMDRMALSVNRGGAVVGGGGNAGSTGSYHAAPMGSTSFAVHPGAGDMDREAATISGMMDDTGAECRDGRLMMSELVLEKVWEINLSQGGPQALDSISAHLFDTRCTSTSPLSFTTSLSLLLPQSSTLLSLRLTRSDDDRLIVVPISHISAVAATSVEATRSTEVQRAGKSKRKWSSGAKGIKDLIYVTVDGHWKLITASGNVEDVQAPRMMPNGARKVVRLDRAAGVRRIRITFDDGSMRETGIELGYAECPVQRRCMEVASLVLPMEHFLAFRKEVTKYQQRTDLTMVGLGPIEQAVKSILGLGSMYGGHVNQSQRTGTDAIDEEPSKDDCLFAHLRSSSSPASLYLPTASASTDISAPDELTYRYLEALLQGFHCLAEDAKVLIDTQHEYELLMPILLLLASGLGKAGWVDAYRRSSGILAPPMAMIVYKKSEYISCLPSHPPNLVGDLLSCLTSSHTLSHTSLDSIAARFSADPSHFYGAVEPCRVTKELIEVYSALSLSSDTSSSPSPAASTSPSSSFPRCQRAVLRMHHLRWKLSPHLDSVIFGIALPLKEAIRVCQIESPEGWNKECYELIGRTDLARQNGGRRKNVRAGRSSAYSKISQQLAVDVICDPTLVLSGHAAESANEDITRLSRATRFGEDRRLEEVERMLQFSEPVTISGGDRVIESLTPPVQQSILLALSNRTLSLPIGFAMFTFRSQLEPATESVPIKLINLSARILPMPSVVALIEKDRSDTTSSGVKEKDRLEWPEFHSGVAAALQLGFDHSQLDSSQISFNRPHDLDARHAGFLMGLGLIGRIGTMVSNQAFEYLKMKHDSTSIGLLLGLAVTYLGTGDAKVTRLLSIHLSAFHPPHSSPLNVSGITQAAGLVGIGLLYLGTARRTLADVMIRELCEIKVTSVEDPLACREAYALSAGFAFGLIMLAKGNETTGEVRLLRTFRALILGDGNRPLPGFGGNATMTDVNITSSAATIALGLMFLKTERCDVAEMLEIPQTVRRLDYVRADLLLLRTLGRSLIMWNSVATSKEWVESYLPLFLRSAFEASIQMKPYDTDLGIAAWNIVAGACFGMGLKFAGTARKEAHMTLIHYLDRLTRAAYVKAGSVQGKIKRHAIRCCLNVVAMSLAMVMAGTGEVNVLRRLRIAHGHFSEGVTYGTHLSSHMALGLLFLGAGRYTLGTSDSSIAALIIAFFPSFPSTPVENRAHLQAYRHLWTLAVEPRCLIARDVDTNEASFLPIRLRLSNDDRPSGLAIKSLELVAPTLIPELRRIDTIQIDSPRYWAFSLHLSKQSSHLANFIADTTLYVKRRTGHLSYSQDPRGNRSIFTRSKSEMGSSVFDLGETARIGGMGSGLANGLREFVKSFLDDEVAIAMVKYLCPETMMEAKEIGTTSEFEAFTASVLLECLTKDKPASIALYHSIFHAISQSSSLSKSTIELLGAEQLRFIIDFYQKGTYGQVFQVTVKASTSGKAAREPLIQSSFIDHLSIKMQQTSASSVRNPDVYAAIRQYITDSSWPVDGRALAGYLGTESAPDSTMIGQLRRLANTSTGSLDVAEQERKKLATKLVMEGASKELERMGGTGWTQSFGDLSVDVWFE